MAYLNTNNSKNAYRFYHLINRLLGYRGATFFRRKENKFIKKYGLYRVGLNLMQEMKTGLRPKQGSGFTDEEVEEILRFKKFLL